MKKSLFLSLLLIGGIALAWCQKSDWEPEVTESKYPVAEQVCLDNEWEVTVDEEWEDICLLGGRAIYLADMEEQTEVEAADDENIDFVLPEWAKTSLTYENLEEIAETNFPTSSTYTVVDLATEEITNKENLYHEDTPHNLVNITPDFAPITEQTLLSSGIEDGMIYTNFDVVYDNGTTGNVLYINDPVTLNFVAATVESEGMSVNYQFAY